MKTYAIFLKAQENLRSAQRYKSFINFSFILTRAFPLGRAASESARSGLKTLLGFSNRW